MGVSLNTASYLCRLGMAEGGVSCVARPLSLEEQLSKFPAELLDRPCVESHLGKLVHDIDTETMVVMATDLELLPVEVDDIQTAWPRKPAIQRLEMFKKWQEKKKSQATYRYGGVGQIYKIMNAVYRVPDSGNV